MNILLVDDEIVVINILKNNIDWESIGINRVFSAYNAFEAKRIIEQNPIDIIICDIEMPRENGLSLLEWVKEQYPHILNIILTGYPEFHYAKSAISIGVYEFLMKPIVFSDLKKTVESAVHKIKSNKIKEKYMKYGEYIASRFDSTNLMEERLNTVTSKIDELISSTEKEQSVVNIVKSYLEKHYNEKISRKDLESLVNLNADYLNRIFKKATGYSLMEYVQFYRIMIGKELLINSDTNISEIATHIGFNSPAYFSKIFKMYTGFTPTEYRSNRKTV